MVVNAMATFQMLYQSQFSLMISSVTLTKMFAVLPFGLMDAMFAGAILILLLTEYFGTKTIIEEKEVG